MNLSIKLTANFLYWFATEADLMKSATFTTNDQNTKWIQIKNPAGPNGEYYWYETPYTIEFENSITIDLYGDPWAEPNVFIEWQKKDRNNFIVDGTSNIEWLNASADATATFVAVYNPLMNLTLDPIVSEDPSGSSYYKNITTGEISNSFYFPMNVPTSIEAVAQEGYDFLKWSDNHLENPRSFSLSSNLGGLYTIFKKNHHSNSQSSFSNNGQRKIVRDDLGYYHSVYTSQNLVWYTKSSSTNFNGETNPSSCYLS